MIHELLVDGDRVVVLQEGERLRLPKRDLDPEALSLPEVCVRLPVLRFGPLPAT